MLFLLTLYDRWGIDLIYSHCDITAIMCEITKKPVMIKIKQKKKTFDCKPIKLTSYVESVTVKLII